jgi:hypothetical protein
MADTEKTEFEFPDEIEEKNTRAGSRVVTPEPAPEIEVVDDTPEADRGRKPMEAPPKDVTDEELAKYDEGVQKRIKHFTKGYHEERRAKEAAMREKDEAIRLAQAIVEENKKLKGSLSTNQTALLEQAKRNVANDMEDARRKYKTAYEAGDSDALVAAQEEMTAAKLKSDKINSFRPPALQEQETEVQLPAQRQESPRVDSKLLAWQEQNTWFGPNRKLTAYALGLHEEIVSDGTPAGSSDYYEKIDAEMRARFPDVFESGNPGDANPPSKRSNVVAPATRSTAPRKVVLTKSQVEIAKRLNVPLELYARKVAEEMRKQA